MKCQSGWIANWNQDCQEKHQQFQIRRWYHSNGRKWGGIKEPLDEGERGEWKSCLEIQHLKNKDHGIWTSHFMANSRGRSGNSNRFSFLGLQNHWVGNCIHGIKKHLLLGKKAMKNLDSILKSRDITLPIGLNSQRYGFSSSHVWIWELDHKEGWVSKN